MARIVEPSDKEKAEWRKWVASRPANIRKVAERFDPWSLYRIKSTGQRCTLCSLAEKEDGGVSVTVAVTGQFNAVLHDRRVFGINPDDLEPCELPDENEQLGTVLSAEEVDANIDVLRATIRPDLWILGPDGKARRKQ